MANVGPSGLSATGTVALTKPASDTLVQVQVGGTYVAAFVIEGTIDGGNTWVGLGAIQNDTRSLVTGTISPAANASLIFDVRAAGYVGVRVRVTSYTSGTATFYLQSGTYSALPDAVPANSVPASLGSAGATLTLLGGLALGSVAAGLTAFAGGGQASATALTATVNSVGTVGTAGDSVKLPAATAGRLVLVQNAAANSANVFPQSGEAINALAANTAFALAAGKAALFFCAANGTWVAILSA